LKSAAAGTEAYDDIVLDEARLTGALALSSEAGWNQEADDWRLLLRQATVFGRVRRRDGALIGSAAVLPLGNRLSWIGMVLVTGAERRRGHGRDLMRRSIGHIEAAGAVAGLDATPAGRELYRSLGFQEAATLMRMGRDVPPSPSGGGAGGGALGIRHAGADDLARLCRYDAQAFGADRAAILRDLYQRRPESAFLAQSDGRLTGFVLARPGRLATQIGPLVADDDQTAGRLLGAAIASLSGPVIVDVFTGHRTVRRLLAEVGFTEQRPFTRMLNGAADLPSDRTVLSAGPELG
jgi:GNAT superfamily N-acetyltransferase